MYKILGLEMYVEFNKDLNDKYPFKNYTISDKDGNLI